MSSLKLDELMSVLGIKDLSQSSIESLQKRFYDSVKSSLVPNFFDMSSSLSPNSLFNSIAKESIINHIPSPTSIQYSSQMESLQKSFSLTTNPTLPSLSMSNSLSNPPRLEQIPQEEKEVEIVEPTRDYESLEKENIKLKKRNSELESVIEDLHYSLSSQNKRILYLEASWYRIKKFEPLLKLLEDNVVKNGGTF